MKDEDEPALPLKTESSKSRVVSDENLTKIDSQQQDLKSSQLIQLEQQVLNNDLWFLKQNTETSLHAITKTLILSQLELTVFN